MPGLRYTAPSAIGALAITDNKNKKNTNEELTSHCATDVEWLQEWCGNERPFSTMGEDEVHTESEFS